MSENELKAFENLIVDLVVQEVEIGRSLPDAKKLVFKHLAKYEADKFASWLATF